MLVGAGRPANPKERPVKPLMPHPDQSTRPTGESRRMLVIFNPTAGWRRRRKLERVLEALRKAGCSCELAETTARGDAERFAREAAGRTDIDLVAVAGGDGTINEAANGLTGSRLPLGIIPMGTANVLAYEIGQGLSPEAIARTLAGGPAVMIHPGRVNDRRFLLMTGVGMDAWVIARLNPRLKKWTGKLAYGWAMLGMIPSPFRGRYRVAADGQTLETGTVLIANARCYGGPFVLAPEARLSSPSLHAYLLDRTGLPSLIRYALALVRGRVGEAAHVRMIETHRLEVMPLAGNMEEWAQGDGDLLARLPLTITVDPEPLWLIVPPGVDHI